MPLNTVFDKKIRLIIRTVTGELTFEEIKSSYEALLSHPDFQKDMHVIWDVRDADPSRFEREDIIRIARYFESKLKYRGDYKAAVVVSRDLESDLTKVYQVAAADFSTKIGIFRSLEAAKRWIMEPD
jgi:hypothetical protein